MVTFDESVKAFSINGGRSTRGDSRCLQNATTRLKVIRCHRSLYKFVVGGRTQSPQFIGTHRQIPLDVVSRRHLSVFSGSIDMP